MAKTAGGIRGRNSRNSTTRFISDARRTFNDIETNYGRNINYSGYQTKRLQSLQRLGRSYDPSEKKRAIQSYSSYAYGQTKGEYRSINHASLEGARSELIQTANKASAYRNLDAISAELKRRKGGG